MRRWVDYYAAERITRIGFGAVILRRRPGAAHWVRALEMATGPSGPSSDHILRLFDAADFLESERGRNVSGHVYGFVDGHRVDQTLNFAAGAYAVGPAVFRLARGIGIEAHVDARALDVLIACDGRRRLSDLVAEAALGRGEAVEDVSRLVEPPVRQLVERGFMVPIVDTSDDMKRRD